MKIYLDDIEILDPNPTLLEPHFTIRRNNEFGQFSISFTGDLEFFGIQYDYLFFKLVTDATAINNFVVLKFIDDCCDNKEYLFLIKPESLKWCDFSCQLSANAVEYTPDSRAYACLESTLVFDDRNGFKSRSFPRVKYCKEYRPSLLQDIVLILGTLVMAVCSVVLPIFFVVVIVVAFINLLITALNLIPGVNISTLDLGGQDLNSGQEFIDVLNWGKSIFNALGQYISGCGYEHPSPLVRDYIQNVCDICGVSFQSSVLNEADTTKPNYDYYNLLYFSAPIKSGRINIPYFAKPLQTYQDDNKPIHNGKTFLDEVAIPFNAKWNIINGVIIFERHDFFETFPPWIDTTIYNKNEIETCYEWSSEKRPAYADISYQRDAIDWVGAEATPLWSDIIEWNPPPISPIQKGAFEKLFPYSAARFRNDGIEKDVLTSFEFLPFGIGSSISNNDAAMIMSSGISFIPKLLIRDTNSEYNNSRIKYDYNVPGIARPYNYPMWVDATRTGNLYDRFWAIENPRNETFIGFNFTIKLTMTCQILNTLDINGTIITSNGVSKKLESIELDFEKKTVLIKGSL